MQNYIIKAKSKKTIIITTSVIFLLSIATLQAGSGNGNNGMPELCPRSECHDPSMGMPNERCYDGSTGGPLCVRLPNGKCGWTVRQCPKKEANDIEKEPPVAFTGYRLPEGFHQKRKNYPPVDDSGRTIDKEIEALRESLPMIKMPWCFREGGCRRPVRFNQEQESRHTRWMELLPYGGQKFSGIHFNPELHSTLQSKKAMDECRAIIKNYKATIPVLQIGEFDLNPPHPFFKPRRSLLKRFLDCEHRKGELVKATDRLYLTLESVELKVPGYFHDHKNPRLFTDRYFIVCSGAIGRGLYTLKKGFIFSFLDNTFTLPCGFVYFDKQYPQDYGRAAGLSGIINYRVHSAWAKIIRQPEPDNPEYEILFSIIVENLAGTLELSGTARGEMTTYIRYLSVDRYQRKHP